MYSIHVLKCSAALQLNQFLAVEHLWCLKWVVAMIVFVLFVGVYLPLAAWKLTSFLYFLSFCASFKNCPQCSALQLGHVRCSSIDDPWNEISFWTSGNELQRCALQFVVRFSKWKLTKIFCWRLSNQSEMLCLFCWLVWCFGLIFCDEFDDWWMCHSFWIFWTQKNSSKSQIVDFFNSFFKKKSRFCAFVSLSAVRRWSRFWRPHSGATSRGVKWVDFFIFFVFLSFLTFFVCSINVYFMYVYVLLILFFFIYSGVPLFVLNLFRETVRLANRTFCGSPFNTKVYRETFYSFLVNDFLVSIITQGLSSASRLPLGGTLVLGGIAEMSWIDWKKQTRWTF